MRFWHNSIIDIGNYYFWLHVIEGGHLVNRQPYRCAVLLVRLLAGCCRGAEGASYQAAMHCALSTILYHFQKM